MKNELWIAHEDGGGFMGQLCVSVGLIMRSDLEFARQLRDAREPIGPVPEILIRHGLACIGYGPRCEALRLGWLTPRGRDWLRDVESGGEWGAMLAAQWEAEQRERFEDSMGKGWEKSDV